MKFLPLLALAILAPAADATVQPVIDFTILRPLPGEEVKPSPRLPAGYLTDDVTWTGEPRREFQQGGLHFTAGTKPGGATISIAGPARETLRSRDFGDLLGFHGPAAAPVVASELIVAVRGSGTLELSLLDVAGKPRWHSAITVSRDPSQPVILPLDGGKIGRVKSVAFSVAADAELDLKSISLGFADQEPDPAKRLFVASLAKLHRCHDAATGLTGDRAQVSSGTFIAVPCSGLHALAIAAAADSGVFDPAIARAEVGKTVASVLSIPTVRGFLPHFALRSKDGTIIGTPESEYSTIDSAITLQSLLLAVRILGMDEEARRISEAIRGMDWSAMIDGQGFVRHGYAADRQTVLQASYRGWGGEAGLSLLLEAMSRSAEASGKMNPSGKTFRCRGFIAEIQSLLHPDFDRADKDLVSGTSWLEARRSLMTDQSTYFIRYFPQSAAAREGLWGLSAGEAGGKYGAFGSDDPDCHWIHPHYQVMATCMLDRGGIGKMVAAYDRLALLTPFGLPEGFEADNSKRNPMDGSLNASFEALAAYHGWKGRGVGANAIDRASLADPLIRAAMRRFYDDLTPGDKPPSTPASPR